MSSGGARKRWVRPSGCERTSRRRSISNIGCWALSSILQGRAVRSDHVMGLLAKALRGLAVQETLGVRGRIAWGVWFAVLAGLPRPLGGKSLHRAAQSNQSSERGQIADPVHSRAATLPAASVRLPPMTIVVTGAAGFIGAAACARLLARGEAVVGVDDYNAYYDPALKAQRVAGLESQPGFRMVKVDIAEATPHGGARQRGAPRNGDPPGRAGGCALLARQSLRV